MDTVAQLSCDTIADMTPEQEAAVAALDASARRVARTKAASKEASELHIADALTALRAGVPPTVVERHSPFTGSYIRRLARENGIEGDPRYVRRSEPKRGGENRAEA